MSLSQDFFFFKNFIMKFFKHRAKYKGKDSEHSPSDSANVQLYLSLCIHTFFFLAEPLTVNCRHHDTSLYLSMHLLRIRIFS